MMMMKIIIVKLNDKLRCVKTISLSLSLSLPLSLSVSINVCVRVDASVFKCVSFCTAMENKNIILPSAS
jgi:hypothetical protein